MYQINIDGYWNLGEFAESTLGRWISTVDLNDKKKIMDWCLQQSCMYYSTSSTTMVHTIISYQFRANHVNKKSIFSGKDFFLKKFCDFCESDKR